MDGNIISVILWVTTGGAALFTVLLALVLGYHWVRFAMNPFATIVALCVNASVCVFLLIALVSAAASYSL